jgi:rubredoxin
MISFTCPHCGVTTETTREDVEWVDIASTAFLFPRLPPGVERHVDERLCCPKCYEAHDDRRRDEKGQKIGPHRFTNQFHQATRLARAVGDRRP